MLFAVGVALAIWSTERLLRGLLGVAGLLHLSPFGAGAVLSGLEAENVALGLAAGQRGVDAVALGSVFGGAMFLICIAFGLSLVVAPFPVRFPPHLLLLFAAAPVISGIALLGSATPRWAGAVLLALFAGSMVLVLRTGSTTSLLISEEMEEALEAPLLPPRAAVFTTLLGIGVLAVGGELIAGGAQGLIAGWGIPALLMGMVVTPACVELDEIVREIVPALAGRADVSAGNLIGTQFYFVLCNLGLIALLTPAAVQPSVRTLDWPFLVAVSWLTAFALWRGWAGRALGAVLVASYAGSVVLHIATGR